MPRGLNKIRHELIIIAICASILALLFNNVGAYHFSFTVHLPAAVPFHLRSLSLSPVRYTITTSVVAIPVKSLFASKLPVYRRGGEARGALWRCHVDTH